MYNDYVNDGLHPSESSVEERIDEDCLIQTTLKPKQQSEKKLILMDSSKVKTHLSTPFPQKSVTNMQGR